MFEPGRLIKRAFQIVWNYKVLWIFGFLVVLVGGASSGGNGGFSYSTSAPSEFNEFKDFNGFGQIFPSGEYSPQMQKVADWYNANVAPLFATPARAMTTILIFIGIMFGIALLFGLLGALVRYPADTALMRMVNDHEQSGARVRFKEGWRLGWNRRAWRIFLVDLLIGTPAGGIVLLLVGGLAMYFIANRQNPESAINAGVVVWMVIVGMLLMALGFVMLVISIVRHFIIRKVAFDDLGVWEGFRQGWAMFKQNWKQAVLTWLILFGIGMAFGIALMVVAVLLIPAYVVLAIPGLIAAAIPAAVAHVITGLFAGEVLPWIIAAVVGLPIFSVVIASPLTLINGVYYVFTSNLWTLLYRERAAAGSMPPVLTDAAVEIPPLPAGEK